MTGGMSIPPLPDGWRDQVRQAADSFGTPLFVYFYDAMEARLAALRAALPDGAHLYYSAKANPNPFILRFYADRGLGVEVASLGEFSTASRADVPAGRIIFVGPAKTDEELSAAAAAGVEAVVVESVTELARLARLASGDAPVSVALRLDLGRSGGRLAMSGETQFGMNAEEAWRVLGSANSLPSLRIVGLHTYAGTQQKSVEEVAATCRALMEQAARLQEGTPARLTFLDFGGGFGTPVRARDPSPEWSGLRAALAPHVAEYRKRHPWTVRMAFESGRFLMAPAGILVTTVQDVKTKNTRRFALLDGGIAQFGFDDHYRGTRPPVIEVLASADVPTRAPPGKATLCGPLCTPADRIASEIDLPPLRRGDRVCVFNTGAYGLTGNPGLFLGRGFAAEAAVTANGIHLIRRRFTAAEFTALTVPLHAAPGEVT
ncbi:alanine racemase [Marichromatium gracile]|uniref:Diaminopimelate decarboxylase n=1 Tax=Marichromatium gracile TaxID=1048 RepID=A0A4R4A6Y6_MARGR|nr:alanine racemase [Marichromatium gracile]MBK1710405.1 hypothetical protein [Marichromatium gracile]TCW34577.1 diaminopimelate decarboxylase [Marichromatium gracile]